MLPFAQYLLQQSIQANLLRQIGKELLLCSFFRASLYAQQISINFPGSIPIRKVFVLENTLHLIQAQITHALYLHLHFLSMIETSNKNYRKVW